MAHTDVLDPVDDEVQAIRDAIEERRLLDEKVRIRKAIEAQRPEEPAPAPLKPFSSRFDVPPEFTPEQRAEKAAATMKRLIENLAQFVPMQATIDLRMLEATRLKPDERVLNASFTGRRKIVAERYLDPEDPGFLRSLFTLTPRRTEALINASIGFGLEAVGAEGPTSEALLESAFRILRDVEREMAAGKSTIPLTNLSAAVVGETVGDLAMLAASFMATKGAASAAAAPIKKRLKSAVIRSAVKRKLSTGTTQALVKMALRSPETGARFAAASALDAALRTWAATGNAPETLLNALASGAVGGTLGVLFAGIPTLGAVFKEIRVASRPRLLLDLPARGELTRQQIHDAALSKMTQLRIEAAPISKIVEVAKTAEFLTKQEGLTTPVRPAGAAVTPEAPGLPKVIEPRPGELTLARPAKGTPEDPSTAPNTKAFGVPAKSLETQAAKPKAVQKVESAVDWHSTPGDASAGGPPPATPPNPSRIPIWASVKGLAAGTRIGRKARVFFRRQQFVRVKQPESIFDAEVPITPAVLQKLTGAMKKANPRRGHAEALKAKERSRRAAQMARLQAQFRGREGALRAAAVLKGEYPSVGFDPIGKFFARAEQDGIFDHINTHRSLEGFSFAKARLTLVMRAILDDGYLPTRGELGEIEAIFGPRFAGAIFKKVDPWKRLGVNALEVVTLPRTIIAAYDLSATLRQGFSMMLSNPLISARSFSAQLRALASEKNALAMDKALRRSPAQRLRERAGLELTSVTGQFTQLAEREEVFMSRLIQKFANLKLRGPGRVLEPLRWHGMGVRASERAYVTYLNQLRANSFDSWAAMLREGGFNPGNPAHFRHFENLAKFINAATGRGNLNVLRGPVANAIFFSPRFLTSRFEHLLLQLPKNALLPGAPFALRQLAMRQIVGKAMVWFGMAKLIEFAAEAYDLDIEMVTDPRSSDFLKIRFGKTRIDMGVGYGQVIRVVVKLASGVSIDPITQRVSSVDPVTASAFFLMYKLSPSPSAIVSIMRGQTPSRDPATFLNLLEQLTVPISAQTISEIVHEHGARGLVLMVPEVLGVGVSVQDKELEDPEQLQNRSFAITRPGASRADAIIVLRSLLSRGVTPTQLRNALRAEAIEQARSRALRRKPRPTAAAVERAARNALDAESYLSRRRRLNELLTAARTR